MANQVDPSQMKLLAELEIEMMSDMYNRMTASCHKKCIPSRYDSPELLKAESVCIERCVAKYLDIHERVGQKLTAISMQEQQQQAAANQQ